MAGDKIANGQGIAAHGRAWLMALYRGDPELKDAINDSLEALVGRKRKEEE